MQDGLNLTLGASALSAIIGALTMYFRSKVSQPRKIEQPLEVKKSNAYVTCDMCVEHRLGIDKRINIIAPLLNSINNQLARIEEKNEERATRMHERLDPIIKTSAATAETLKEHLSDHRAKI